MKYHIKQRYPNFFSGFSPKEYDFDTVEELIEFPFVKNWMSKGDCLRLSKSRMESKQQLLICELTDGTYWAIGFLTNSYDLDLPIFNNKTVNKAI